jgi:hypothetical protein
MELSLPLFDITVLLAISALILLVTAELTSSYYGKINLIIDKSRLRQVSTLVGLLFILTIILNILSIN